MTFRSGSSLLGDNAAMDLLSGGFSFVNINQPKRFTKLTDPDVARQDYPELHRWHTETGEQQAHAVDRRLEATVGPLFQHLKDTGIVEVMLPDGKCLRASLKVKAAAELPETFIRDLELGVDHKQKLPLESLTDAKGQLTDAAKEKYPFDTSFVLNLQLIDQPMDHLKGDLSESSLRSGFDPSSRLHKMFGFLGARKVPQAHKEIISAMHQRLGTTAKQAAHHDDWLGHGITIEGSASSGDIRIRENAIRQGARYQELEDVGVLGEQSVPKTVTHENLSSAIVGWLEARGAPATATQIFSGGDHGRLSMDQSMAIQSSVSLRKTIVLPTGVRQLSSSGAQL